MKNKKIIYLSLIFLVGCLVGWIYEELFFIIIDKKLVNRGFLYGPYLPVYGTGAVFLTLFLKKYKNKPILMFFMAVLITGIVEYVTGYLMESIFNRTWWDYTGLFMNINGYVCLRSVLSFGVLAMILLYLIEPLIYKFVLKYYKHSLIITISFFIVIILDFIITLQFRY